MAVAIVFLMTGCRTEQASMTIIEPLSESTALFQPDKNIEIAGMPADIADVTEPSGFVGDAGLGETLLLLDQSGFQGTVIIGKDNAVVFEKSYGYADIDQEIENSMATTYEIGMITKQFTAAGIMLLVQDGLVGLDSLVSDYLPEYSHAGEITVRQLLNMTSGIPDYLAQSIADRSYTKKLLEKGLTRSETMNAADEFGVMDSSFETVLTIVNDKALSFAPGTEYEYSNTGYVFLAEIIERVSDIPYVHFMQKNILTPEGLETASYEPSSDTASGYLASGKTQLLIPGCMMQAEAGLRMNAKDLFNWSAITLGSDLLSQESWDMILGSGLDAFGFGTEKDEEGNLKIDSAVGGFRCVQVIVPASDLVIIILSNRNSEADIFEQLPGVVIDYYS